MNLTIIQKLAIACIGLFILGAMALGGVKVFLLFLAVFILFFALVFAYFKNGVVIPGGGCSGGVCSTEVDDKCSSGACSATSDNKIIEAEEVDAINEYRSISPRKVISKNSSGESSHGDTFLQVGDLEEVLVPYRVGVAYNLSKLRRKKKFVDLKQL